MNNLLDLIKDKNNKIYGSFVEDLYTEIKW